MERPLLRERERERAREREKEDEATYRLQPTAYKLTLTELSRPSL